MHIAMMISRFPPYVGGTERQAFLLSRELVKRGLEVMVLTHRADPAWLPEETMDGVRVFRLGPAGNSKTASGLFMIHALRFLAAQKIRPDVFHAHMIASPAVLACLAQRFFGSKAVVKTACSGSYGEVVTGRQTWLGRRKLNYVLPRAARMICVSRAIRDELASAGVPRSKIAEIPNGVDTDEFQPVRLPAEKAALRHALGLPSGRWALFAGRLTSQKRPKFLLEAFRQINEEVDARLLILGEGPEKEGLMRELKGTSLENRVVLRGLQPNMRDYYRACDAFVLASAAEGLPNSLLEAMASGLPCVAAEIGGTVDAITNGQNGLLFPPDDATAFARHIKTALFDFAAAGRMGQAARQTMLDRFQLPVIAQRYVELYRSLL